MYNFDSVLGKEVGGQLTARAREIVYLVRSVYSVFEIPKSP